MLNSLDTKSQMKHKVLYEILYVSRDFFKKVQQKHKVLYEIKCKYCKLNHTGKIRKEQTRGADEPRSVWYYCYKCKETVRLQ